MLTMNVEETGHGANRNKQSFMLSAVNIVGPHTTEHLQMEL